MLISSAGDLVAAMANTLGADFAPAFNTFYPLIAKYYVRDNFSLKLAIADLDALSSRKRAALSAIAPLRLDVWQKSFLA